MDPLARAAGHRKTVGELRKVTAWPENLAITPPAGTRSRWRCKGEQGERSDSHITEIVGTTGSI